MSNMVKIENLQGMIIEIRGLNVLLDSDVAHLYGVETKRINEAVKNNPDKFPQDYMFGISKDEFADLRSKISTAKFAKTRVAPNAFTEKGLYMLATIYARYYIAKQAGHRSDLYHHRNLHKNPRTIEKRQRALDNTGQNTAESTDAT